MGAPGPSTLSIISGVIRQRLKSGAFRDVTNFDVTVDRPAGAAKSQQEATGGSILNLFFYRIEPSRFYADGGAHDRWFIRLHCLVTAFSTAETIDDPDSNGTIVVPEGEIDLRVLGEVLRYFNENPVIIPQTPEEDVGASLQMVLIELTSQEINQIWSTQGDLPYRTSLLYEIALLPIKPRVYAVPPLPVVAGGLSTAMHAQMKAATQPSPPSVWVSPRIETGTEDDWAPALAFVSGNVATQSLSLASAPGLTVEVWLAGWSGVAVTLVWESVDEGVWAPVAAGGTVPAVIAAQPVPPGNNVIDPTQAAAAMTLEVAVPVNAPTQLLLHAERRLTDKKVLKSNPLILTVTT